MFNTTQKVSQTIIDGRILPITGLITIDKLKRYCGLYSGKAYSDKLISVLEENNIRILKISEYQDQWLVILDDFINIPQR